MDAQDANGRDVGGATVDTSGERERLPLGREADPTSPHTGELEPILLPFLGREEILERDRDPAEGRVLGEVAVVDLRDMERKEMMSGRITGGETRSPGLTTWTVITEWLLSRTRNSLGDSQLGAKLFLKI